VLHPFPCTSTEGKKGGRSPPFLSDLHHTPRSWNFIQIFIIILSTSLGFLYFGSLNFLFIMSGLKPYLLLPIQIFHKAPQLQELQLCNAAPSLFTIPWEILIVFTDISLNQRMCSCSVISTIPCWMYFCKHMPGFPSFYHNSS
jgi:hypothetical protein